MSELSKLVEKANNLIRSMEDGHSGIDEHIDADESSMLSDEYMGIADELYERAAVYEYLAETMYKIHELKCEE